MCCSNDTFQCLEWWYCHGDSHTANKLRLRSLVVDVIAAHYSHRNDSSNEWTAREREKSFNFQWAIQCAFSQQTKTIASDFHMKRIQFQCDRETRERKREWNVTYSPVSSDYLIVAVVCDFVIFKNETLTDRAICDSTTTVIISCLRDSNRNDDDQVYAFLLRAIRFLFFN